MRGHKYTPEQDEFIRLHFAGGVQACLDGFNKQFGTFLSYGALKTHANRMLKLATGIRPWTPEMDKSIACILRQYPYRQATEVFNGQFGANFTQKQIQNHCTKCGIKREFAVQRKEIDEIIAENIDKTYEEIKAIIHECTGVKYQNYTTVCVRANKQGLHRPHRVWNKDDKRAINGELVTFSEFVRFVGNRWHRIAPELQPIALQVVRLQAATQAGEAPNE